MRPIHDAHLETLCPVLVLTRELVRPHLGTVTVAPVRAEGRGLSTELSLGEDNGVEDGSVVDYHTAYCSLRNETKWNETK